MYTTHFALQSHPFRLTADPRFLYWSAAHSRAKAYIECALQLGDSALIITGEIGCGKTALVEEAISRVSDATIVAHIYQTQLDDVEFLRALAANFGLQPFKAEKVELLHMINAFLTEQHKRGRKVLLIVDEAQNLSPRVLEEIRLLSGLEIDKKKVLNIVLVGQPELNHTLEMPGMEQLLQRVRLRFHITPLDEGESKHYIEHRLAVAGMPHQTLFQTDAFPVIYNYTGGVPRLINVLCDMALLHAYAEGLTSIDGDVVKQAIDELRWLPYSQRQTGSAAQLPDREESQTQLGARLMLTRDGHFVSEYPVHKGLIQIGRKRDNDIKVPGAEVSRRHATVITEDNVSRIEDQGSANGTRVNGEVISVHVLRSGDLITIGPHQLTYIDPRHDHQQTG